MSTDPTARDTSQSTALSHLTRSPAGILLTLLTLILFAQEWITRRPRLWRTGKSTCQTTS